MKTVQYFAFYPHNLPKNTFFAPWSSMNLKNTKSLQFDGVGWGCSAPLPVFRYLISPLQISTNTSLNFSSYLYDEVVQYRLNHHEYGFEFVSGVDWSTSLPRKQNFPAEKIILSCRENFMLDTRINYIPYEKQVHSSKEWSVFS